MSKKQKPRGAYARTGTEDRRRKRPNQGEERICGRCDTPRPTTDFSFMGRICVHCLSASAEKRLTARRESNRNIHSVLQGQRNRYARNRVKMQKLLSLPENTKGIDLRIRETAVKIAAAFDRVQAIEAAMVKGPEMSRK